MLIITVFICRTVAGHKCEIQTSLSLSSVTRPTQHNSLMLIYSAAIMPFSECAYRAATTISASPSVCRQCPLCVCVWRCSECHVKASDSCVYNDQRGTRHQGLSLLYDNTVVLVRWVVQMTCQICY